MPNPRRWVKRCFGRADLLVGPRRSRECAPIPSATWARTETTLAAGRRASKSGVPMRSQKWFFQVEQRSTRVSFGPSRAGTVSRP